VTGDDTITLKSTFDRPCENVSITNCVVSSNCNGIKMGTETNGGFKNVAISNCTIFDTGIAGIALEIVDGGTMDGVTISNISMNGVRTPIFMRLGNRARKFKDDMRTPEVGVMRHVTIDNVTATNATKLGCAISGLPGHPIRDVTLSNIRLRFAGGGRREDTLREVPEKADAYPECTMFGTLPGYGFYCRHVEGIRFDGIDIAWKESDERPAMVFDDVAGLEIESLRAKAPASDLPLLLMTGVMKAIVRGCVAPEGSEAFLALRGECSGISLIGNDLGAAEKMVEFGEGVDPDVLFDEANRKRK
jgi:hypothetical protein